MDFTQSLINGRVFPPNPEPETIFALTSESGGTEREAIAQLSQAILEGAIDVTVCYSSVYDECWTSSLQDVLRRLRGDMVSESTNEANGCDTVQRSGI